MKNNTPPLYNHNGQLLTARQIAKDLNQPHTQTRKLLYAGRPPKIEEKESGVLKLKNWKDAFSDGESDK